MDRQVLVLSSDILFDLVFEQLVLAKGQYARGGLSYTHCG